MSATRIDKGTPDGNDPNNPNGMKLYSYKGQRIAAYCAKDVPMRYKYLFPNGSVREPRKRTK